MNINEIKVRVVLTDIGAAIWRERTGEYRTANDVIEIPLAYFSNIFGPDLYMGATRQPAFLQMNVDVLTKPRMKLTVGAIVTKKRWTDSYYK